MDTRDMITTAFFCLLILITVALSFNRKISTDSIEAFIRVEVARQISELAIPPVIHGKYVDVQVEGGVIVE